MYVCICTVKMVLPHLRYWLAFFMYVCICTVKMVLPHLRYWLAFFHFCRCCFLNFFLVLSRLHKTILFLTVAAVFCFMLFVPGGGGGGGGVHVCSCYCSNNLICFLNNSLGRDRSQEFIFYSATIDCFFNRVCFSKCFFSPPTH